jgi:hypothetical protein
MTWLTSVLMPRATTWHSKQIQPKYLAQRYIQGVSLVLSERLPWMIPPSGVVTITFFIFQAHFSFGIFSNALSSEVRLCSMTVALTILKDAIEGALASPNQSRASQTRPEGFVQLPWFDVYLNHDDGLSNAHPHLTFFCGVCLIRRQRVGGS